METLRHKISSWTCQTSGRIFMRMQIIMHQALLLQITNSVHIHSNHFPPRKKLHVSLLEKCSWRALDWRPYPTIYSSLTQLPECVCGMCAADLFLHKYSTASLPSASIVLLFHCFLCYSRPLQNISNKFHEKILLKFWFALYWIYSLMWENWH